MPTHPPRPEVPEDDDAYVVDTRRRLKRPTGAGTGRPPLARPAASAMAAGDDDAYVVDTRRARPPRSSGSARPSQPSRPSRPARPAPVAAAAPDHESEDWDEFDDAPPPRRTRVRKGRVALLLTGLLVISWLAFMVWVPFAAWGKVERVDNIPEGERPPDTSGYNYLLVGSDSREGLTREQQAELTTGSAKGKRTDTIMLVHVSESGGKPAIISIPRDSYVPIPGEGTNKINAAFAWGGAKLLTQTVEQSTGLHIDGYVEIGLGGFAAIVDSLGGVTICVPRDMKDDKAGIDLKKGCQVLAGPDALGYVRSRYEDPLGDIGRANRQRQFLGALMKQAATPSTVLIPWKYKSFADAAAGGLIVGEETGLMDAVRVLQAMRAVSNDEGLSLTVPIADTNYQTRNAGVAVKWDTEKALALFKTLKNDDPLTAPPPGTTQEK